MFNHDTLSKDASVKKKCFSGSSDLVLWHTACFGDIARAKQIATALSTLHTPEVSEAQVNSFKYVNSAFCLLQFCALLLLCNFACCTSAQAYPFVRFVVNEEITLLKQFCMCSDGVSAIGGLLATVMWNEFWPTKCFSLTIFCGLVFVKKALTTYARTLCDACLPQS